MSQLHEKVKKAKGSAEKEANLQSSKYSGNFDSAVTEEAKKYLPGLLKTPDYLQEPIDFSSLPEGLQPSKPFTLADSTEVHLLASRLPPNLVGTACSPESRKRRLAEYRLKRAKRPSSGHKSLLIKPCEQVSKNNRGPKKANKRQKTNEQYS